MNIHIHLHDHRQSEQKLNRILENQLLTIKNQRKLMANDQEIIDMLVEADEATNEIAADLQDLINSQGVSQEVKDRLRGHVDRLKGVASQPTPTTTEPGDGDTEPGDTEPTPGL